MVELDVERQTELIHQPGTIWAAVFKADKVLIKALISDNSSVIYERGPVGECPIHMLFLYGTDAHLEIARDLLIRYPTLVKQTYNKLVELYSFFWLINRDDLDLYW
jgi:hypothetical protein